MASSTADLNSLFSAAQQKGLVSQATAESLNAPDVGRVIRAALGVDADQFDSSEVYLSVVVVDDSASIRDAGNAPVMRDGLNLLRQELLESQSRDDILYTILTINGEVVYPFGALSTSPVIDEANYRPCKGTPLYDSMITGAGLLIAKWREFAALGATCRGSILFVTDGADVHSTAKPRAVAPVIQDLLMRETFIPMFMGIDDGRTDFKQVALSCGIPEQWVLTPANSGSEIRKAFAVASRASKTASQGAKGFSQVATGGGFGQMTI